MDDNETLRNIRAFESAASGLSDRIASVFDQAEKVLEGRNVATKWTSTPKQALGGKAPGHFCETEIGTSQVRRVLQALESGEVL